VPEQTAAACFTFTLEPWRHRRTLSIDSDDLCASVSADVCLWILQGLCTSTGRSSSSELTVGSGQRRWTWRRSAVIVSCWARGRTWCCYWQRRCLSWRHRSVLGAVTGVESDCSGRPRTTSRPTRGSCSTSPLHSPETKPKVCELWITTSLIFHALAVLSSSQRTDSHEIWCN